jgi:hypothetical protein
MARAQRRIRSIDRVIAAHITKIGLKSRFFSSLLGYDDDVGEDARLLIGRPRSPGHWLIAQGG